MSEEIPTAGTPDPEGSDAAATQTGGTQGTDDRNAATADDKEQEHLIWKAKAERANQLEAENAALRERLQQSPAVAAPEHADDDEEELLRVNQEFAAKGDVASKLALRAYERNKALAQEIGHAQQLRDISDMTERREVFEHFQRNRHRLGDPAAARAEIREKKLEAQNEALRKELAKHSRKPDPDVVRTEAREVPASEHKIRKMTQAEFDAVQKQLAREGRHRERMQMQNEYAANRIVLEG